MGEEKKESDEHEKQSGSEKSSLNPMYWIVAFGLVLWWKWDEVETWFN
jgi:hypothetical protein